MTTQDELAALVALQPWNDTFADMLFEWWYCDADKSWAEAEAEVKRVRGPALAAHWLAEAARELSRDGKYTGRLYARILGAVQLSPGMGARVITIEGTAAPELHNHTATAMEPYWAGLLITVGAEWVVATVKQIAAEWHPETLALVTARRPVRKRGRRPD